MLPSFAAANLLDSTEFIVGTVLLVLVLLGGAIVIWALDRWRKKQELAGLQSTESLSNFRALFENGEISEEEYKRIRDRVSNQMRTEVGLSKPTPAPAAQSDVATEVVTEPPPDPPPVKPPDPVP